MLVPLYRVAGPSEYLAITGWKIQDIKLAKKALILPGQRFVRVNVPPVNYTFEVQAMSAEKLPFLLPAVFTIGPRVDSDDSLVLYAKLMAPHDMCSKHVNELVQGIIEGETRVLAASMTMEEIFRGTKEFKKEVFDKEEVKVKSEVKIYENQKEADVAKANAELAAQKAGWEKAAQLARVEAKQAVSIREAELQVEVEKKNALTRTEKLRAELLSEATVEYDIKVQEANQNLYNNQREADANLYEKQKQAEAEKATAEAAFYSRQQAADADLYGKKKEAEGIVALAQAQGFYISTLLKALDGSYAG
uniref:Flotillin-like n=1 Tax=Chenopodium quinoa TaxID=63459 RepID=A0A803L5Y8_CHEQI